MVAEAVDAGAVPIPPNLHAQLSMASWEDPNRFAESLVRTLVDELRLAAASLWLFTDQHQPLRWRAAHGLATAAYERFELELTRYPGQAVMSESVQEVEPIELVSSPTYLNKGILPSSAQGGMVTGPLRVPEASPDGHEHIGVSGVIGALCLYPEAASERSALRVWLEENGAFLGRLYIASLERYSMELRRTIVRRVAFRKDLGSLEHNFLRLMRDIYAVEAAQLWLGDPADEIVYLDREIGREAREVHDEPPLPYGHDGPVMRTFTTGETQIHTRSRPIAGAEQLADGLTDARLSNAMLVPLPLAPEARLRGYRMPCAGVLVLLNHKVQVDGLEQLATPTWEDRFIARFSCQMFAVLMFQMWKARDYDSDFERLMHGARSSLQGPLNHLPALDADLLATVLPDNQRNYISDSIFWLEEIMAQINRNELIQQETLDNEPVHLFNAVLTKVDAMGRRIAPHPPLARPVILGLESSRLTRTLPRVWGNAAALTCVFRNLVDNGVKYAPRLEGYVPEVRFELAVSDDRARVLVTVSDNGIGVPPEDRDLIFEDRFRGATARAHVPSGVGRGLHDCRTLLRRMGGEIKLVETPQGQPGARFQVALPVAGGRGSAR